MDFNFLKSIPQNIVEKAVEIVIVIVVGTLVIQLLAFIAGKLVGKGRSKHLKMLVRRSIVYIGVALMFIIILKILEVKSGAIFGAAGVFGIVLGVASQNSIGNIVSGLFLISERSFELGDLVKVGDKTGIVDSIDLLSIKLKTMDNMLIRIPNQTIISTELTNVTRFPIRRMDVMVSVAYKEDLRRVTALINEVLFANEFCLDEPEPLVMFKDFGDSGINIHLGLWFEKTRYKALRNSIFVEIKERFDKEGIEIPFPHISLYAGEASKPVKVELGTRS